jgi:type I protein arginine methyltransferase
MYSLRQFGHMISDLVRMEAYDRAIAAAVKPGDVVVDLGAGTGIFSLLACKYGARHVYAIDYNPAVNVGIEHARANGFAERITFIRANSTTVTLPERADVVLGDIRGRLPPLQIGIEVYRDARKRFLKPGGVIIPESDRIFVAPVEDEALYRREVIEPWQENRLGLDLSVSLPSITSSQVAHRLEDYTTLLPPQIWVELDYAGGEYKRTAGTMTFQSDRPRELHFLALWFDTVLFEGIGFSNAPGGETPRVYNQVLLPLAHPVSMNQGDRLEVDLRSDRMRDDYILTWRCRLYREGAEHPVVDLRQSNFDALPIESLSKRSESFVPEITPAGRASGRAITLMAGGASVGDAARAILEEFPELDFDESRALTLAADLSQQYSS